MIKLPEKIELRLKKDYHPSKTSAVALRDLNWYIAFQEKLQKRYSNSEETFP